jgi:hypothetical protein
MDDDSQEDDNNTPASTTIASTTSKKKKKKKRKTETAASMALRSSDKHSTRRTSFLELVKTVRDKRPWAVFNDGDQFNTDTHSRKQAEPNRSWRL